MTLFLLLHPRCRGHGRLFILSSVSWRRSRQQMENGEQKMMYLGREGAPPIRPRYMYFCIKFRRCPDQIYVKSDPDTLETH